MNMFLAAIAISAVAAFFHPVGQVRAATPPAPPIGATVEPPAERHPGFLVKGRLEVPFVPQSEALCGGAALAMILRHGGARAVLAEDFAHLVEPTGRGIRAGALVQAARDRGWTAVAVTGTPRLAQEHLSRGRPVMALIDAGTPVLHYVVVVAWSSGVVVAHDPAVAPNRTWSEAEFRRAWDRSGSWMLLATPPAVHVTPPAVPPPPPTAGSTPADSLRRLAAERFRADDWTGAAGHAERVLALEPADSLTWRLLAGCRFLDGDVAGALAAWNRVGEPRMDLARIDGLVRTRYGPVAKQLDLPPHRLITPGAFLRARRRLAEIPAREASRLSLKPLGGGTAEVQVALLERPLLFDGPWDAGGTAVRSLVQREVTLHLAAPLGHGELWTAGYRWWPERPRAVLELALPAAGNRPGIWRVSGLWEREAYAAPGAGNEPESTATVIIRERRRRTALSLSDWIGPNLRLATGAAYDRWDDRGEFVALDGGLDSRWVDDRIALTAALAGWVGTASAGPFRAGSVQLRWRPPGGSHAGYHARVGVEGVSSRAPLSLWPGAGTGQARTPLLRAHPLLDGGVVTGRTIGRTLLHGGLEWQSRARVIGPLRVSWAAFVDAARATRTLSGANAPWQVDGGLGLRLSGPARGGQLRIDLARGFEDGRTALSAGWTVR